LSFLSLIEPLDQSRTSHSDQSIYRAFEPTGGT
jgi:hypothetical protein